MTLNDLQKYLLSVFKLTLETKQEVLLDCDMNQLALKTAKHCFDYNLVDDLENGTIGTSEIMRWLNKQSGKLY